MTRSAFFIFLISCLIVRTSVAQSGDSLVLFDLAQSGKAKKFLPAYRKQIDNLFENRKYDSALVLLHAFRESPVSRDQEVKANIFLDIAIAYDNLGEVTKAGIYFEDAQKLATDQDDKFLLAESYFKKGKFYYKTSGMDSSLRSFEKAAGLFKELKDTVQLCNSLAQIGMVLDNNGIYTKALDYYFEALRLEELRGDSSSISASLNNIAIIYKKQEDMASAEDYYLKARAISEARGDRVSTAISDVNLGLLYKDLGKLDIADSILNNCLQVFIDENNAYAQSIVYHNIGAVKLAKKEWITAREFFARSQELSI